MLIIAAACVLLTTQPPLSAFDRLDKPQQALLKREAVNYFELDGVVYDRSIELQLREVLRPTPVDGRTRAPRLTEAEEDLILAFRPEPLGMTTIYAPPPLWWAAPPHEPITPYLVYVEGGEYHAARWHNTPEGVGPNEGIIFLGEPRSPSRVIPSGVGGDIARSVFRWQPPAVYIHAIDLPDTVMQSRELPADHPFYVVPLGPSGHIMEDPYSGREFPLDKGRYVAPPPPLDASALADAIDRGAITLGRWKRVERRIPRAEQTTNHNGKLRDRQVEWVRQDVPLKFKPAPPPPP